MCICINCRHLHYCKTYSFIETQHNLSKKHDISSFIPINTLMQINLKIYNNQYTLDWDLIECLSFIEYPGSWLIVQKNKKL
uniref:Ycf34 n=1 Tax=Antithamnion hubbsii TaxID=1005974 RepID=A0A4D6WL96_9FLOR|nr:hypothetical protein [Antithamnion hubbsii]